MDQNEKLMRFVNADEIGKHLSYDLLIPAIKEAFANKLKVPKRHHHNFRNPGKKDSTLLLMPSWEEGKDTGVKVVTISPENGNIGLPSIHGLYLYFDGVSGQPLAVMDAGALTKIRTAATSALASSFLSNKNVSRMLMVGTGVLAPELIKAHSIVRDIHEVLIWGRDFSKAEKIAKELKLEGISITAIKSLEEGVKNAQIISTATLSQEPLIKGEWITQAKHIDLVGSYRPDMREADDDVITKSKVYVDAIEGAISESGDLAIPLQNGTIKKSDILGDLFGLCSGETLVKSDKKSTTLFKSVGHAIEDLVAARLVFSKCLKG